MPKTADKERNTHDTTLDSSVTMWCSAAVVCHSNIGDRAGFTAFATERDIIDGQATTSVKQTIRLC